MRTKLLLLPLALCVSLAACDPGGDLAPLPDRMAGEYRLGPGDRLRIITYGDDELTGDFTVNGAGDLQVPLLGTVHAGGQTAPGLQRAMVAALRKRGLLHNPSVSVEVAQYRPIFVLGEVTKPGQYPYQPDMTVLTAVAVAGGFTYRAVKRRAEITRTEDGHGVDGAAMPETLVQPGDVVTILERSF